MLHPLHRLLPWLLCCLLLGACERPPELTELHGRTMGTSYSVKYLAGAAAPAAAALQEEIERLLAAINKTMSTYDPDSELSRFNRAPADDWVAVSVELYTVVAAARRISELSDGAFDITVGPLVNLWGFGPQPPRDRVPPAAAIAAARERVGYRMLALRNQPPALRKTRPDLYVDLSAIAKGYAVDRVAELLERHAIRDYLVEIGGELRASGRNAQASPWRVAVEKPLAGARSVETVIAVERGSIATSGDYRNFFEVDGQRYSHEIDPHSGWPIAHRLASVTVVADNCMEADAWATALLVLGPQNGPALAERLGLAALFISGEADGFREHATPAFVPYLTGP
ncbi:MAG TPA: FAD:protein FMN transferase [Candidatus Competibacteraceae bacterium]|nr:FAD:protein FMN transferase [Candidatus Competibacteraceae bacterium]